MIDTMDQKSKSRILAFLCVCLLIWACAGPVREGTPDAAALYKKAVSLERAGKNLEACQSYTLLWKTYPGNELAPKSLHRAASVISSSDPDRSIELYQAFLTSYPHSPLAPQARLNLLDEEISQGRYTMAFDLFTDMYKNPDPKLDWQGIRLTRGLAGAGRPDKVLALTCMIFPHGDKPFQEALLPLWKDALEKTTGLETIVGLEAKVHDELLRGPLLARKEALQNEGENEFAPGTSGSQDNEILAWTKQGSKTDKGTVGVLLPLSGKYEPIGQKALKGIELASGVFAPGSTSPVSYAIRDYGDNEQAIPGIIESLDSAEHIIAIIGPIGETAGGIACKEAQKRGIPSLVFTRAEVLSNQNSFCFSNFVSVNVQVEALLKAASERGITRFGILYPTDNFGKTFTASFTRKARGFGILVLRQVQYSPDLGDFKSSVQKLFKGPAKAKGGEASFQGLLIPDSAQNAGMIASYLPYLNIKGVRLFGPTLWDSADLPKIGGRSTEDALFVSGFYLNSQLKKVQVFNESFYSTFGYKPSLWEANAYDSASILQLLSADAAPARKSLQQGIGALQNYPGLTGTTSFGKNGSVSKSIYLLTIKNGTVVEVIP
jgi:branched-chain amino acid transport system substrate-binding protein